MRTKAILVCLILGGLLTCHGKTPASATEPIDNGSPATDGGGSISLAQSVLLAESEGDLAERSRRMIDLLEGDAKDDLGRSVAGKIRERTGWKSVEESIAENRQLPAIDRYERLRSGQPDSVQGHINVAQWCRQAGLEAQSGAHWRRVLQLAPNNQIARIALGHRRVDGVWVSPQERMRLAAEVSALRISLEKHGESLMKLYADMLQDRQARRDVAVQRFHKVEAADAIPAVAAIFAMAPSPLIDQAVQWMSQMPEPAAAAILARWSVDHPRQPIRDLCIEALKRRSVHEFVPVLLDRTRSRTASSMVPSFRPDGTLAGVRHVFSRETKDDFDVAVVDSVNIRQWTVDRPQRTDREFSTGGPSRMERAIELAQLRREHQIRNALIDRQVRAEATREAMQRERIAAAENLTTDTVNHRIRHVLSQTAGTDPEAPLYELWDWWSDYTEREPAPIKLASLNYRRDVSQSRFYSTSAPPPPPGAHECFVAGTSVISSRGEKPIESLVVGDQVLSKNIYTGELVWDAVLTTTTQPAKPLVTVDTDSDQFQCTGGHLFWVSGKGWTKARDLQEGNLLHGLSCPAVVRSVAEADAEPTYNLVTAQHHNYFVGEGKILSHDFDERMPTAVRVPGLDYALNY